MTSSPPPVSISGTQNQIWGLITNTVVIIAAISLSIYFVMPETAVAAWIPSLLIRAVIAGVVTVTVGIALSESWNVPSPPVSGALDLVSPEEYAAQGVGPLAAAATPQALYLDLMKRTVSNIIYEDHPYSFYDDQRQPLIADQFRLDRRVNGEDFPREAHTMVGIKRLNNLQQCVETVLKENVPGDLLEAGVLRGGAAIFLRSILKAYGITDRKIIACDTFRPSMRPGRNFALDFGMRLMSLLAWIPLKGLQRYLFDLSLKLPPEKRSFPVAESPSDEAVFSVVFFLRHLRWYCQPHKDQTGLEAMRSHFARYGLLDDQVQFVKGFFSESLPAASIGPLAMIRLDGDLYESTRDAIVPLYPKLSPGGYCIVDDYYAFTDCQRAIDEYRAAHGITAEMHRIDKMAVYWRKP